MKIIRDSFDPSGMGMFSKTGRVTTEKFYILRKKDDILSTKKRTIKIPLFSASSKIVSPNNPSNNLQISLNTQNPKN